MFAALNIHKPVGMTSHDVVSRLRRIYGLKRIGHLGTLDPLAEGVLPLCLGQATRLIEYFPDDKRYCARVTLGRTTTTLDAEGDELTRQDCHGLDVSRERLEALLTQFTGEIDQQVPLYSAVHVGGKKLYELARQGKTATLPTRRVNIHALALLDVDYTDPAHPVLSLDVHCSSGTYIRSLSRDIGEALGCGAYMSGLVRTAHGQFSGTQSVTLEALQASDNPQAFLLNPVAYLDMPTLPLTDATMAQQVLNGMKIVPGPGVKLRTNQHYLALFEENPLAVVRAEGCFEDSRVKPVKVFSTLQPSMP